MTNILMPSSHFPSVIYTIDKPEFLTPVRTVSKRYLEDRKNSKPKPDPMWPVQTNGFFHEPELAEFTAFIAQSAWGILEDQGHDMSNSETYFLEMWSQEHNQYNGHEEHIHNRGAQITGLYFLDCPEGGSKMAIHDPRYGKNQINLPEADLEKITVASSTALFAPVPGRMYFINSWLPHSVTRNPIKSPTRLVHFNLGVRAASLKVVQSAPPEATVI